MPNGRVLSTVPEPGASEQTSVGILFDEDSVSLTSHTISVDNKKYVVRAFGLTEGITVTVLNVAGPGSGTLEEAVKIAGSAVTLNETNNTLVIDISGRYRFRLSGGLGEVTLVGHESDIPDSTYGIGILVG